MQDSRHSRRNPVSEVMRMSSPVKEGRLVSSLRIAAVAYAFFLMLFSFDVFQVEAPFLGKVVGFIAHSAPSIALLAAIALTWKRPQIMGAALILFGVFITLRFATYEMLATFAMLSLLPLVTGFGLIWAGRRR